MKIALTFADLTRLAVNGTVTKDGVTLTLERLIVPDVKTNTDGTGFVRFTAE